MSTFYATFNDWTAAKSAVFELINGGVSPDDLSLVVCKNLIDAIEIEEGREMRHSPATVGDATSFVGREDDPSRSQAAPPHADITNLTSLETSRLSPIDTSNSETDVDSIDQMEDSQNEAELEIRTHDGISYGDHEKDDLALTVTTGFPTASQNFSYSDLANPFEQGEQNTDSLEILEIPGIGLVIGGGPLATAALDFAKTDGDCSAAGLIEQLTDEGVPNDEARNYQMLFTRGEAILAVTVTPGELNEDALEEITERHGAKNGNLYDAPRY